MALISSEDKLWAALGYLGILCLLPLLLKKDNSFAQFHAKQGLIMAIIGVIVGIVSIPVGLMVMIPVLGWIVGIAWTIIIVVFGLAFFVLWVIALINVFQGKTWKMPVVGNFAERINF